MANISKCLNSFIFIFELAIINKPILDKRTGLPKISLVTNIKNSLSCRCPEEATDKNF